jgi:aryl-alcohol dehydrogenase-like predicted oxidoreductase
MDDPAREAKLMLRAAISYGMNYLDTADSYNKGAAEQFICETLYPYSDDLVIATKGGSPVKEGGGYDGSRSHIRNAVEGSLRRLRQNEIALYYLHKVDPNVPIEDSVGAMLELQNEGKIRHIGISNVTLSELKRAQAVGKVAAVQNGYSMAEPHQHRRNNPALINGTVQDDDADDMINYCSATGVAWIPWGPTGKGRLAMATGAISIVADKYGASRIQVALSWLIGRWPNSVIQPGPSTLAELRDCAGAALLRLSKEELADLESGTLVPDYPDDSRYSANYILKNSGRG